MENLYDLIASVIDHNPVELERCGLLKDLAELAELLDRIWQTAQAMHTERPDERASIRLLGAITSGYCDCR